MASSSAQTLAGAHSKVNPINRFCMSIPISLAHDYFLDLQDRIAKRLSLADGTEFHTDRWTREEGGGGISRYLENGPLFERGAVLFSHVKGNHLPPSATAQRPDLKGQIGRASSRESVGTAGGAVSPKKERRRPGTTEPEQHTQEDAGTVCSKRSRRSV